MLVRTIVLCCPSGLGLLPGVVGPLGPTEMPEEAGGPADPPPALVTLSVPFQAPGMAATGMEATRRPPATVSVCFSLSELGEKLQLSSRGLS